MAAELAAAVAEQAAAAAEAQGDSQAAAALAQTLAGEQVQEALAMAERARAVAAMQAAAEAAAAAQAAAAQPGQPGEQPGAQPGQPGQQAGMQQPQGPAGRGPNLDDTPQTSPVGIAAADRRGLDPATRAAIEKLPPHVRDPLLEGMRERGPEAYRGVIEAYFKRLGQEIPR